MNARTPRPHAAGTSPILGCLIALLLTFLSPLAFAQATGGLSGRITDANTQAFLRGVEVRLEGSDQRTSTDASGQYAFRNLAPGAYTVLFSYLGYGDASAQATVSAGETARLDMTLGGEVKELDEVVVRGFVEGRARALNNERTAQNIVDIISSDSFGEFPDKSIADAVRRLPGVTVERNQGDGEGRYVTIRGMNADFNAVSLNGIRVMVSNFDNASRSVPLDVVSSRSAETIEVSKAVRPDQDGDAIGGAVSIRTRSPFDRDGRTITLDAAATYNNLIGKYDSGYYLDPWGYEFGAGYSDVFTQDGKWALAVTANTRGTPYGTQSVDTRGWTTVNDDGGSLEGLYVPTGVVLQDFFDRIDQTGATLALEHRPAEGQEIRLNVSHNIRDSRRGRQRQEIRFDPETFFWIGGEPITAVGDTITEFTSDNRLFRQVRDFYETQELTAVSVDGRHASGVNTFSWLAGWSRGNFEGDEDRDLNATFRTGFADNAYSYEPGSYEPVFGSSRNRDNPSQFNLFSLDLGTRFTKDEELVLRADWERETYLLGGIGFLKAGAQARFRERDLENVDRFYDSSTASGFSSIGWNLGLADFRGQGSPVARYGSDGFANDAYDFGFYIDPDITRAIVDDLLSQGTLRFTTAGQLDSDVRSIIGSYEAREDVYALYGMAQTVVGKWTLMAGVRAELTKMTFDAANGIGADGLFTAFVPVTRSDSYIDLLPGVHVRYDANPSLVIRGAVTRTLTRPSYTQLNPAGRVDNDDFTATLGSEELDPVRSTNFDLFADYYLGKLGVISGGVFY